jgi:hypothetical protein
MNKKYFIRKKIKTAIERFWTKILYLFIKCSMLKPNCFPVACCKIRTLMNTVTKNINATTSIDIMAANENKNILVNVNIESSKNKNLSF